MKKLWVYIGGRTTVFGALAAMIVLSVAELSAQDASPRSLEFSDASPQSFVPRRATPELPIETTIPKHSLALPNQPFAIPGHGATTLESPFPPRLVAPKLRPFALTPMERLDIANLSSVGELRRSLNLGGEMTLLARKSRANASSYSLGLIGQRQSYPGMGFSNSVAVRQTWTPTDGITLSGGIYVSDNLFHTNRFKDLGVSGRVRIKVAERVALTGFGNYSLYNSGSGGTPLPPMMYPQNNYGGGVQLRLTDKFGLEGGVRRDYNVFTRKWETSPYILPVFY